ncbi:MAG: pilin [Candidatus Uhrbacteria bacterium]|nr:pilin [Candidatus Uhrbacteria bacterium]
MSNILTKKHLGYILGAVMALTIGAIALMGVQDVSAQALTADELFGGAESGAEFAGTAGLGEADIVDTIAQIVRIALGFLGVIAVLIILVGGFQWMTAGGNDDKVKLAKKRIFAGIIGLVIVISAYAIASFVINSLITATTGSVEEPIVTE